MREESALQKCQEENAALKKQIEDSQSRFHLLEEYKKVVDEGNIVSKTDRKGVIAYVNDLFCEISEYSREELIGKNHNIICHPDMPKEAFEDLWNTISSGKTWRGVIKNRKKNGGTYHVNSTVIPLLDEQGKIVEYIAIRTDVTAIIEQQEKIKRQTTDQLTGLPNREKLLEDIESYSFSGMALVNIDGFQQINGFYGHKIADALLCKIADKLVELLSQSNCMLYKLPADEYAILFFGNIDIEVMLRQIHDSIDKKDILIHDYEIHVGITLGGTKCQNRPLVSCHNALKDARIGKKDFLIYSDISEIYFRYKHNLEWIQKLKKGLESGQVQAYFQPIHDNATKKIYKYESLVRFIEEDGKVTSPYEFLTIAKHSKIYNKITQVVVKESIRQTKKCNAYFSINLSIEDIEDPSTVQFIKQELKNFDRPGHMIFEITESEGIENFHDVSEFIREIRTLGCKVAIDDFGTGYSNFEYLMRLQVDFLKIDGSLIRNITTDAHMQIIVDTIIQFTKRLGIQTIAEFVGDEKTQEMVLKMGADFSQGFLFGKPVANPKCFNMR